MVVATQNPIEQQGTYPLPEAQLDRFLFKQMLDYPDAARRSARIVATHGSRSGHARPGRPGRRAGRRRQAIAAAAGETVASVRLTDEIVGYVARPGPRHARDARPAERRLAARRRHAGRSPRGPGRRSTGATTSSPTT